MDLSLFLGLFDHTGLFAVDGVFQLGCDKTVVVFSVRHHTVCAVFYTLFSISEISSAAFSEEIQRTVTEQTVEIVRVCLLVTGEILTVFICKVFETVFHFAPAVFTKQRTEGSSGPPMHKIFKNQRFSGFLGTEARRGCCPLR